MGADGAHAGGFLAHMDVTAVAALPDVLVAALEDHAVFQVLQQGAVALLVLLLDLAHALEQEGQLGKALLPGGLGHLLIHGGPFLILALGGGEQVGGGVANAAQLLEPDLGMLLLVSGGLLEESGDLLKALLLGLGGKIVVLVAGHGLASKGFPQIGLGLATLQFHRYISFLIFVPLMGIIPVKDYTTMLFKMQA